MKKIFNKEQLKKFLLLVIGAYITSVAVIVFYQPNKIVGGGISGISTILYHLFNVPTSVTFFLGNFIFCRQLFSF